MTSMVESDNTLLNNINVCIVGGSTNSVEEMLVKSLQLISPQLLQGKRTWATKKTTLTFHYTGCLIGIPYDGLVESPHNQVVESPIYIIYTLNNQVFCFMAHIFPPTIIGTPPPPGCTSEVVSQFPLTHSHRIHGTGIFTYSFTIKHHPFT